MKTIVVKILKDEPFGIDWSDIYAALADTFKNARFDVTELPGAGEGEKSCRNCAGDCCPTWEKPLTVKVCENWQPVPPGKVDDVKCPTCGHPKHVNDCGVDSLPIPGKIDDKNQCDCCQKGVTDICEKFEPMTDKNFKEHDEYCKHCGHHKSCHEAGKGEG
jgi:hypothetical protein